MKNINSKNLLFICFISAMGGYLFGYDWVVIGGAKIFYEPFFAIEDSAAFRLLWRSVLYNVLQSLRLYGYRVV